jgi:hypothetical protein
MNVGAVLVADSQAPILVQPRQGAFDNSPGFTQTATMPGASLLDQRPDE